MEHLGEIIKKQTPINISGASTGTWSGGEGTAKSSNPTCSICKGTRFVHPLLPSGKPDFSRVTACRCTRVESARERQECLLRESGLHLPLLKSMTFESFDWKRVNLPPEQRENLEFVYREALEFAKSPEGWLVLLGVTGCGKTHLAAAIANYQISLGKPVKFVGVPDLLDHLRSAFNPDSKESYGEVFEEVKNKPLLILDDFGEQSTTPWAEEKLYQIINYRYNAQLAMVITSSFTLEQLDEKGDTPIVSRMLDPKISVVWNMTVPDYRCDVRHSQKNRRSRK